MSRNHEITTPGLLLNSEGELREPGWSRKMILGYDRSMIKAPKFRIKEWDYYLVLSDTFAGAFTIENGQRHISCHFENFHENKPFSCEITLAQPDMDTMVIATPWDKKHAFYYNQKINCMRASGYMEYDGKRYEFHPETDFGTLDWGRGVWTYDNTWFWGSGNTDINGNSFGFNIGYGFGNTTAASENILFWNGKAHKLDDITFHIPETGYTDPWKFTSSDGRFEMDFIPVLDRAANLDYKVIVSDQHQVFGRMSGKAVLDDGTVIEVRDMMCFAEKVHNRY